MASAVTTTTVQQIHRQALVAPLAELARFLQELLTRRLTAYIAGVQDAKTVTRWANGEVTEIRDLAVEQRLRTAYEIAQLLLDAESTPTIRAWFLGMDPRLGDTSPAEAIREGRLKEAMGTARAFAAGI